MTVEGGPPLSRSLCGALAALAVTLAALTASPGPAGASSPEVDATPFTQVSVAGAGATACGLRGSGRLYCWGFDFSGQLGDGGANADQDAPSEVFGGATNWVQVSVGASHTCGRQDDDRLFCWGSDSFGQVGDGGANVDQAIPVEVAGSSTDWADVDAGGNSTCAVKTTGALYCWGSGSAGQLGNGGPNTGRLTPGPVGGGFLWQQVDNGFEYSCGLRRAGQLLCWGNDSAGQLGNGAPRRQQHLPVPVAGPTTRWKTVGAGFRHACAVARSGHLFCWGSDEHGRLGDGGANLNRFSPTQVGAATNWSHADGGGEFSCGLRSTGVAYCWGIDSLGQLGNGPGSTADRSTPGRVA